MRPDMMRIMMRRPSSGTLCVSVKMIDWRPRECLRMWNHNVDEKKIFLYPPCKFKYPSKFEDSKNLEQSLQIVIFFILNCFIVKNYCVLRHECWFHKHLLFLFCCSLRHCKFHIVGQNGQHINNVHSILQETAFVRRSC